jgi:hypothetical protein
MDYSLDIMLLDAVEELEERLEILFEENEISGPLYQRRKAYKHLLRAVNKADRHLSSFRKKLKTVSIFVPAGLRILPLRLHDVYAAEPVDSVLASTLASVHPSGIEAFLYKEPWHNVTGINGKIYVYSTALFTENKTEDITPNCYKETTQTGFTAQTAEETYWFDASNFILHLGKAVASDSFLVFEASTVPGVIDVNEYNVGKRSDAETTELADHTLDTPLIMEELLLKTALAYLLPTKIQPPSPQDLLNGMEGLENGNGAVVWNVLD